MNIQGQALALTYASFMPAPAVQGAQNAQTPLVAAAPINPSGGQMDMLEVTQEAQSMYNRHLDALSGVCNTCATRAYVCSDGGVSRPSAGNAAAYVVAHEQAHLADDRAEAQAEGNRIVAQDIAIFSDTCPECGVIFTSGGEARSLIASEEVAGADHPALEVMSGGCGADGSCCGCGCCGSLG
ncbi:MAG: hypothetical protein FWB96_10715 [Defluviitaleaceae bacterium]|nr:hypothetical protein [Defluviitaleaceae bacterium]MCL2263360.1 hypothetical protein [Defluviitaleaceae bacterium]